MSIEEYKRLVEDLTPKEPKKKNYIISFLVGGLIGVLNEFIASFINMIFYLSKSDSYMWSSLIIIFIVCLLTCLGKFDDLVSKYKCGLIIPTTGFAHSVASSMLDYKFEGFITGVGSNYFKLAGSVILTGIISSFIFVALKVIMYG